MTLLIFLNKSTLEKRDLFRCVLKLHFIIVEKISFLESKIGEECFPIEAYKQRTVVNQFIPLNMKKRNEEKLQQQSALCYRFTKSGVD